VLSRFALAIPAVVVGGCNVRTALFRSDELTEGKWLHLAALLTKGIVGGYVAGMLPFWIAQWIWNYVPIPSLALRIASVMAVIPIEPVMFIGFSLMYVAGRAKQSEGALFTDIVAVS
jgi:fructose-specific phosphotransferase system IIC component